MRQEAILKDVQPFEDRKTTKCSFKPKRQQYGTTWHPQYKELGRYLCAKCGTQSKHQHIKGRCRGAAWLQTCVATAIKAENKIGDVQGT